MKKVFAVFISSFALINLLANKALAQSVFGINDLADAGILLGTRSIEETIGGIVNIFLGFLGILATLLLIYAGFLWMTSRGNAEKVERAKLLIASALIGLVIILSAYAISRFILGNLYNEVGPTGPGGGGGPGPGGLPTCSEPLDPNEALICGASIGTGPVGSGLTLYGHHFDTDVTDSVIGYVDIGGEVAEVVECAGTSMWYADRVKVRIPDALTPGTYDIILYNDIGNASVETPRFQFTVTPGTSNVNIDCLVPNNEAAGNLPINVQILGNGFTDTTSTVSMTAWDIVNSVEVPVNLNITSWSDLEINASVPAEALSSNVTVTVGPDSDSEFFNVTCSVNSDCTSVCCNNLSCVPDSVCSGTVINPSGNAPVIQSVSPIDGEEDTLVTIYGYNFGNTPGTVTFGGVTAQLPSALSGGACTDVWTDTYIVVGVSDLSPLNDFSGVVDVVVTQAAGAGGEISDPYPGFTVNDQVRPGICSLGASQGQFGDVIAVTGINFSASDEAYFDTVASYDTIVTPPNTATAEVPNVVGNLGVTMQTTANVSSNAYPFSALSTIGGAPIISELSPDNGPVGSYVTIMGSNFGDDQGIVWFDQDNDPFNGNEVAGDFNFPAVCGIDYWFNDHIIVKVPSGAWTIGNSYPIRIERNPDNALSNDQDFTINNAPLGPQICLVNPDNGPVGNQVTISGENFGTTQGDVIFYNGVTAANIGNWSANQIFGAEIPVGADTGPLLVRDTASNDSNEVVFEVGACQNDLQCGVDFCCPGTNGNYCAPSCGVVLNSCEYTWDVFTQAEPFELYYNYSCTSGLQSPTPWPDQHQGVGADGFLASQNSIDAFVDANISAVFTRDVEDSDLVIGNVEVWECGTGNIFDPTACSNQIFDSDGALEIINHNTNREGFVFDPAGNLAPDTWYDVRLGTFEAAIGTDTWAPDPVNDQWHFKTRDSSLICEVSSVAVTPQSPQANMYPGRENNFSASAIADNCNICGSQYDWNWSITNDPNPISASISGPTTNLDVSQGQTRLLGGPQSTELLNTPPTFITLMAENVDFAVSGETYPVILAPALRVEGRTPDCSDSCTNVAVWADFSTAIQGPLNTADFAIYQCTDPNCSAWNTGTNYTNNLNPVVIPGQPYRVEILHNPLPANQSYIVILNANLTNTHGYALGIDYRWDFGVGDTNCSITGAEIVPDNYTAYSANDINYRGYAIADAGICGAQPIQCENCDFNWSSDNGAVATIDPGGLAAQSVLATPQANGNANISLNLDGSGLGLGQANASTPLTVNISNNTNITQLAVDNYYPNCGACTNSIAEVWFNSDLQAGTVDSSSIRIYDITDGQYDTLLSPPNIIGSRHVVLDHGPFDMGHDYRIEVSNTVLNTDGDNIAVGWQSPPILIEEQGCLADAVWVDPVLATAGRNQSLSYRAVTTYNAAACGAVPVNCATCSYSWQNNTLGSFNDTTLQTPNFTTLGTVNNGDSATMTLNALEGVNALPVTSGTLNISLSAGGGSPLDIVDYWPDCNGACDNSQVGIQFNSPLDASTLGGQYSIVDITTPNNITVNYTLTGGDRVLIIEHDPLILGHEYQVNVATGIQNMDGNNLSSPLTFNFIVGDTDCRINGVDVLPASITATLPPQQGISYTAQPMANTPSCGPIPVYCSTCTYTWQDAPNDLGTFSSGISQTELFTTYSAPPLTNGQSTQIQVQVNDQGNTFSDFGDLSISVGPSTNQQVTLIDVFPPTNLVQYCTNIVPYMDFDISQGDLDRNSLEQQAKFYSRIFTPPPHTQVPFTLNYVQIAPNVLRVIYEPQTLLDTLSTFFFGFSDMSQVTAVGGNPIIDAVGISNVNLTDDGGLFITGNNACSIHRIEVLPEQDNFTCIDNNGCPDDVNAAAGNQHQYQSIAYDIQNNILSSAGNTYTWSSDDTNVVNPLGVASANIYATAGDNGFAHLNVEAFLNTEPGNVVSNNNSVQVSACQSPWPSLATYPWDPNDSPDMNFSTYYCEEYGTPGEVPLPSINIPNTVNSPDPDVLREYITTINYPVTANTNNYLGSLAYYEDGAPNSWLNKFASLFKTQKAKGQGASTVDIIAVRVMSNPLHLSVADWYARYAPNPQGGGTPITVNGYEALQAGASIYVAASNIEGGLIYTNIYIIAHNVGANQTTLEIYDQMVDNFRLNTNLAAPSENTCVSQTGLSCSSDFDCPNFCNGATGTNQQDCINNGGSWLPDTCDAPLQKLRRDTKRLSDLMNINFALSEYGENHKACSYNSNVSCNNDGDCQGIGPVGTCEPYFPALNSGTYLNGLSNTKWPSWQETLSQTIGLPLPVDPINLFNGCSNPRDPETCWDEVAREFICPANSLVYMYNIENSGYEYYIGANFEYDMQSPAPSVTFANNLFNPITSPNFTMDLNINNPYCNAIVVNAPGAAANPYCGNGRIDSNYCVGKPNITNETTCVGSGFIWVRAEECDNEFWDFACSENPDGSPTTLGSGGASGWWNEQTVGCNPPGSPNECTWYVPNPPLTAAQCGGYCGDGTRQAYYESCDGSVPNSNYTCAEAGVSPFCGGNCQVLCDNGSTTYPAALCGDGVWSPGIEQCDPSANPTGTAGWDCTEGGSVSCSNTCQLTCSIGDPYQGLCGDGTVNSTINPNTGDPYEACDYANYTAALPVNATSTNTYGCSLNCEMNGQYCGDGVTQYAYQELCDWNGGYASPDPLYSGEFNQYACRSTGTYTSINGGTYESCTPTLDGWCGDGRVQDGVTYPDYGEECDPGNLAKGILAYPPPPSTINSSLNNQYLCDVDCVGRTGGYCGDGKAQQTMFCSNNPGQLCVRDADCATGICEPLEVCDLSDYPGRPLPFQSSINNTYTCNASCDGSASGGGYCGDGIEQDKYYEGCDWGDPSDPDYGDKIPWPLAGSKLSNLSSPVNQYVCSDCVNFGGYCGNGIVDGACTTGGGVPVNCTDWYCVENGMINYAIDQVDCTGVGRVWQPTSSFGCTEYQCNQAGGNFSAYEQCDNGFDPVTLVQKDVDIVYIFDTSGSLADEAADLCTSLATVVNTLNTSPTTQDIDYRITIFPLGDGSTADGDGAELTAGLEDNIQYFFEEVRGDTTVSVPLTDRAFDALYTDCSQLVVNTLTAETIDPQKIRYLSFYDDATNDINGPVYQAYNGSINFDHYSTIANHWTIFNQATHNDDNHHFLGDGVNETCHLYDLTENWGYAMKRVIEDYNWLPGYHRIVVPVSDEHAVCGDGGGYLGSGPNMDNEDFDDENGVYDVLVDAVDKAILNKIYINPVLLDDPLLSDIGQRMADSTGGQFTSDTDPSSWQVQTLNVINSTICDGAGPDGVPDGQMDCTIDPNWTPIPPPPPPVPVVTAYSTSIYAGDSFSYTIQATNSPQSYGFSGLGGLNINASTGLISGTPTVGPGSYPITITATNAGGTGQATLDLTIDSFPTPVINSPTTATITDGNSFNYTITIDPASNPDNDTIIYTINSLLPAGLTLDPGTGVISGTPTVGPGTYNLLLEAINTTRNISGTATLVLTINPQAPVINSASSVNATQSLYFSYTILASNNPTTYNFTGSLPLGVSFNPSNGVISGYPAATGFYSGTISAGNISGTDSQPLNITVGPCAGNGQSCVSTPCCSSYSCNSSNVCSNVIIRLN